MEIKLTYKELEKIALEAGADYMNTFIRELKLKTSIPDEVLEEVIKKSRMYSIKLGSIISRVGTNV